MGTHPIFESDFDCLTDMEVVWKRENQHLPFVLEGFATTSNATGVFFFGGADDDMQESNALYHYNVEVKSFVKYSVEGEAAPAGRSNAALGFANGTIFVIGGLNQATGWLGDAWKGEVVGSTVKWSQIESLGSGLTPRDKMAYCQTESKMYLIGGFGPIESIDDDDEDEEDELKQEKEQQEAMSLGWFDEVLEFDFIEGTINEITWDGNEGIAGKAAANAYYTNGEIFIFGGRSPKGRSDKLARLNLKLTEWEEEKPGGFPPVARSFGAGVKLDEKSFLLFGGTDRSDQLIGGLHIFRDGKWAKVETAGDEFITPRRQAALTVGASDREIVLFGGVDKVNQETGVNSVLCDVWTGTLRPLTNKARVDMADVLGLKRKL